MIDIEELISNTPELNTTHKYNNHLEFIIGSYKYLKNNILDRSSKKYSYFEELQTIYGDFIGSFYYYTNLQLETVIRNLSDDEIAAYNVCSVAKYIIELNNGFTIVEKANAMISLFENFINKLAE